MGPHPSDLAPVYEVLQVSTKIKTTYGFVKCSLRVVLEHIYDAVELELF